ncbi:MAG: hypothetical protein ABIY51_06290 [Ferruginibacter sp.]
MKKHFVIEAVLMMITVCLLSTNNNGLKACDTHAMTTSSFPVLQEKKSQPKPVVKEQKKKEKDESFLMFLNPFIKI